MAFLERASPMGGTWKAQLQDEAAASDAHGYLTGLWGECLVDAVRYEHENCNWDSDPAYKKDGPAGQVIAYLVRRGHRRLEKAANKLERATGRALRSGLGAAAADQEDSPEVWRIVLQRAAAGHTAQRAPPAVDGDSGTEDGSRDESSHGSGSSGSSSRSSSGSRSGSSSSGAAKELLAAAGVATPLPWQCCMNEEVENAPHVVPQEIFASLLPGTDVRILKKVSDGWHEGYLVSICPPADDGEQWKAILRIWRSQLSYWHLDVPISSAVELQAMAIAREAGVVTAMCAMGPGNTGILSGQCARPPRGETCDWALMEFVDHAKERQVQKGLKSRGLSENEFIIRTMVKLHSLDLTSRDTGVLPRFESWQQHVDYLARIAAEANHEDAIRAVAKARELLESVPDLPPALCHLDWHFGNALCDKRGNLLALIDWEFAGVGDPRLDLARFCRHECWTGGSDGLRRKEGNEAQDLWSLYASVHFGPDADALTVLGPLEPWLALESVLVLVTGSTVCSRVARCQHEDAAAMDNIPRCDLLEWVEDMDMAKTHLRRMGLL